MDPTFAQWDFILILSIVFKESFFYLYTLVFSFFRLPFAIASSIGAAACIVPHIRSKLLVKIIIGLMILFEVGVSVFLLLTKPLPRTSSQSYNAMPDFDEFLYNYMESSRIIQWVNSNVNISVFIHLSSMPYHWLWLSLELQSYYVSSSCVLGA